MTATLQENFADRNRDLASAFDRYMVARGLSPKTRRAYRDTVTRLLQMFGSRSVLEARHADIRELQSELLARGLSPNSLLIHTAAVKQFYKFLRVAGLIRIDPCLQIAVRRVPRRIPRVLTVEEIERLVSACETPFERAVVEVLYATGIRISELCSLRLEQVDFASQIMTVRKGKGGKDRIVPFGEYARAALCIYLAERKDGLLFEHHGKPYSTAGIRWAVYELGVRANVPGVHPHAFRRAFATHMLASGANIRAVQDLLGHECLSTLQLYTNLQIGDLQRAYEAAHPHAAVRE